MGKNYSYRMDHDTGFAPHIAGRLCFLSGCKQTSVELWAGNGNWVIGIGGINTTKPDRLIYAMKVRENLLFDDFKKKYPKESRYLNPKDPDRAPGTNVLVSNEFYYFGHNAPALPKRLVHIAFDRHGCKCIGDADIHELEKYLAKLNYRLGTHGIPNNQTAPKNPKCKKQTRKKVCFSTRAKKC